YLIFENYPLINRSSVNVLQQVLPKEPGRRADLVRIPGNGDLKDPDNTELLTRTIKDLLSNPR
ncbi:MAG: hypothetical protein ACPF9D_10545, partial [Owenweeksia sp.]